MSSTVIKIQCLLSLLSVNVHSYLIFVFMLLYFSFVHRIHHYCIERQNDGTVMIPDGRRFPGPVELIHHHSQYLDGFLTKPKIPCARPNGMVPMAWPGVTMLELEQILLEEASNQKLTKVF